MQAFSASPSSSSSNCSFLSSQSSNSSKFQFRIPFKNFHSSSSSYPLLYHPICCHKSSSSSSPSSPPPASAPALVQEKAEAYAASLENDSDEDDYEVTEKIRSAKKSLEELLVVRRPKMESSAEEEKEDEEDDEDDEDSENESSNLSSTSMFIDAKLSNFAKSMPIFEPERIKAASFSGEKPLLVNLDLALYRAKILTRNYQYEEAEKILQKVEYSAFCNFNFIFYVLVSVSFKIVLTIDIYGLSQCIYYWPEDGRPYVALGKVLSKQSKMNEARAVYEKGCQATQGENPYIWQVSFLCYFYFFMLMIPLYVKLMIVLNSGHA